MDSLQTAVSAEFTMLNVLPFRKELLSSKADELLSVFFKYMLTALHLFLQDNDPVAYC